MISSLEKRILDLESINKNLKIDVVNASIENMKR